MQNETNEIIGQCSKGHDVRVSHDMIGDIDKALVGTEIFEPLPDGQSTKSIDVVCEECHKILQDHLLK